MDTYALIIAFSAVIVISFFFNIISDRTKIPSVLLLMILGIVMKQWMQEDEIAAVTEILPILGNVGLIMIVLEAALDLELEKEKLPIIAKSLGVAAISLAASSIAIAYALFYMLPGDPPFMNCLVYAVPLSIMSSAIIIPSVGSLSGKKKEFMVYESTVSDILGIMYFYFLVGAEEQGGSQEIAFWIIGNIVITLILAAIVAYGLVLVFQRLKSQVKLFLIISVLMLMYAIGKQFHLSSLIIILAFGLVLNNTDVFFKGRLNKYVNEKATEPIMHDFHTITLETAFVIRTFFFVIFGISIVLDSLTALNVALISAAIIGILYAIRYVALKIIVKRNITPQVYLAPRGLITILLYFSILSEHHEYILSSFDPGILLYTIIITSIIMAIALITNRGEKVGQVLMSNIRDNIKDLTDLPKSVIQGRNTENKTDYGTGQAPSGPPGFSREEDDS